MPDPYRAHQPYQGSAADAPSPLTLTISLLHPAVEPGSELTTYAVAKVRAATAPLAQNRPVVLAVLVLDISGSMHGEPIAQVLHSAKRLAEILDDRDQLGIVTFSDGADIVAPLESLGQRRRELIRKIDTIKIKNRTNIAGGLAQAALLFPQRQLGERQIVVLMSDGAPNVGATTPDELGRAARLLKARDIGISTLGFGAHHNDAVLSAIAEGGGGRYQFVIDPKMSESSFIRALGAQLDMVAERNALVLTPSNHVEIVRVLDAPPTSFGAGGLKLSLPDLLGGDELCFVVELRLRAPRESTLLRTLSCKLAGHVAGSSLTFETVVHADTHVTLVASNATDPAVHAAVTLARASEKRAQARALGERGSYGEAEQVLRDAQQLIEETPGFVKGEPGALDDAWEALQDDLTIMQKRLQKSEYERYKKAAMSYGEFNSAGSRARGDSPEFSPSSKMLFAKAREHVSMPNAFLHVLAGPRAGVRVSIDRPRFIMGRSQSGIDLTLPDAGVSRQAAAIEFLDGAFWLIDLGSTNAPEYNGQRVDRLKLENGMVFSLASSQLRYEEE
ncbi:MAG: VWA domain-containing protein [Polyangiaceae bacterium]|nr:VWA domain-containing protein [Polyangiaceae bacterium]